MYKRQVHKCEFEHIRKILCILITVFVMINSFLAEAEGMTEDLSKAEFAALYNNILKFSSRKPTISAVHNKGLLQNGPRKGGTLSEG